MTFDELQKAWQEETGLKVTVDSDMLLREVKRNKEHFASVIFWRDIREGGLAFLVAGFFLYHGLKGSMWSSVVLGLFCAGVGVFLIADRILQKKKRPEFAGTLAGCIEGSLAQVEHQIWLLRNIFWWYLLPILIGVAISTAHTGWLLRDLPRKDLILHFVRSSAIWVFLTLGIYFLNQCAAQKVLMPRRKELETLLKSLTNDSEIN